MTSAIKFKVGTKVKWIQANFSKLKKCGAIIKINKRTALVRDDHGYEFPLKLDTLTVIN